MNKAILFLTAIMSLGGAACAANADTTDEPSANAPGTSESNVDVQPAGGGGPGICKGAPCLEPNTTGWGVQPAGGGGPGICKGAPCLEPNGEHWDVQPTGGGGPGICKGAPCVQPEIADGY
ncbi:MAG TPA: hypothetical protein VNO21_21075 [Polyangiaceae bacterium]|nr:hypothetical protein [Polyangiaceae bacterium]